MRVLVTGGHGFIGGHVVRALLAEGHAVRCLLRSAGRASALAGVDVEIAIGDLRHPASLHGAVTDVTHVIHLAGLTRSLTRAAMWRTNCEGTLALYDAAAAAGVPGRFVYCSSQAAAGPAPTPEPLTESQASAPPLSWYGESKQAAEQALRAREPGLRVAVLRPPAVYGPGDKDFLSMFQGIQRGLAPIVGDPAACYSLIYASDLAAAFVRALEADLRPDPYFVAHAQVVTAMEIAAAAERAVGRAARRLRLPASLLRLVGRTADLVSQLSGRPSLLGAQRMREVAAKHWVCSPRAFEEAAGWRADVDLEAGFAATVAAYRSAGRLSQRVR